MRYDIKIEFGYYDWQKVEAVDSDSAIKIAIEQARKEMTPKDICVFKVEALRIPEAKP
jgi:hypothetical protein